MTYTKQAGQVPSRQKLVGKDVESSTDGSAGCDGSRHMPNYHNH